MDLLWYRNTADETQAITRHFTGKTCYNKSDEAFFLMMLAMFIVQ